MRGRSCLERSNKGQNAGSWLIEAESARTSTPCRATTRVETVSDAVKQCMQGVGARGAARERMCKQAINRQSDKQVEGACAVDTQRTCKESMSHSEVRQEQRDA